MIYKISGTSGFEFARISALRAAQLMRGSVARVPQAHKHMITAQREVAAGKILALPRETKTK